LLYCVLHAAAAAAAGAIIDDYDDDQKEEEEDHASGASFILAPLPFTSAVRPSRYTKRPYITNIPWWHCLHSSTHLIR